MGFKILGQVAGTTSEQAVYTVPASTEAVFNIAVCNISGSSGSFSVALSDDTTPLDSEWINWEEGLSANGSFERTGVCLQAGKKVIFKSSQTGISVSVWGTERGV